MKRNPAITYLLTTSLTVCLLVGTAPAGNTDLTAQAKKILDSTGIQGGILVHLGCVAEARDYIHTQGIYGPVSVEQFSGSRLPYADNVVNLVFVQEQGNIGRREVMRVLAPGGVACGLRNGQWIQITKPWPGNIDQWTHFLHDASNNAVADDTVVGQPRNLHWVAPPRWLRSHETPSGIQSPVHSDGRMFYFFDEGLIGITDQRIPDRWSLICRDAFNGRQLWRRELGPWGWQQWSPEQYNQDWTTLRGKRTDVPNENHRRIVADGDRIFVTLSYQALPGAHVDSGCGHRPDHLDGRSHERRERNTRQRRNRGGLLSRDTGRFGQTPRIPRRSRRETRGRRRQDLQGALAQTNRRDSHALAGD